VASPLARVLLDQLDRGPDGEDEPAAAGAHEPHVGALLLEAEEEEEDESVTLAAGLLRA
jgi:hypothetical protein